MAELDEEEWLEALPDLEEEWPKIVPALMDTLMPVLLQTGTNVSHI